MVCSIPNDPFALAMWQAHGYAPLLYRNALAYIKRRIVSRKDYDIVWLDAVEKNSMVLHLRKLMQEGRVEWDGEHYLRKG
jgi:hypothetical protein